MADFFFNYGLFFLKSITILVSIVVVIIFVAGAASSDKPAGSGSLKGKITVTKLNDQYQEMQESLEAVVLPQLDLKDCEKERKKEGKQEKKRQQKLKKDKASAATRKRVFVINFDGDIKASGVSQLREEVTAILTLAKPEDEVVCRLESPGGVVHGYGLAASQLCRFKDAGIPLTAVVDKVAASGGYMMAVAADTILAAPFAIVGSVGVVAQVPNIHRLLKKHDVDVELHTAGEYKRTLTMLGENTDEGRAKFLEDLHETHELFKEHIAQLRPSLAVDEIATGEVWYGSKAQGVGLIDGVTTSDAYLTNKAKTEDIFEVKLVEKKALGEKLGIAASMAVDRVFTRFIEKGTERQLP